MSTVLTRSPIRVFFAHAISDVFSPPAIAGPALAFGAWASHSPGTYRYALIYYCIAVLLPVIYVVWASALVGLPTFTYRIPAMLLDRIFEKGETDPAKEEGTGLGLAIVKTFIEAHSGTIIVESNEGCGSTFRFSLPGKVESSDGLRSAVGAEPQ